MSERIISETWTNVRLEDVTDLNPRLPFEGVSDELLVTFLPMKNVEELSNKVSLNEERKYSQVKKGFTPMTNGDVIFAKITPCMENGKIAIVNNLKNNIAFGSTEFHVFRCTEAILNGYLFYYIVREEFRRKAEQNMTGAVGQRRVPKKFLQDQIIPLPPLAEQHRIVARIEELFSSLDKGVEALRTAQQQLKVYRQAVLKYGFEGRLTHPELKEGELPEGWETQKIEDIAFINPKLPQENIQDILEVTFLPMKNVEEVRNRIDVSEIRKYDQVKKGYTSMIDSDIIFAKITPCMENGKIAIVGGLKNGIAFGSTEFHVLRCMESVSNKYLFYFLVQERFRQEAERNMTGAVGQRRVPKKFLEEYPIPMPLNTSEQEEIVKEIESRLSVCEKIEESIEQSLKQAEALRQSILKKAFEGKLVPQDPNDEPASVLLERIRQANPLKARSPRKSKVS